jgi:hypothetical protein
MWAPRQHAPERMARFLYHGREGFCRMQVHRLDRPTGGLIMIAKSRPALAALSAAFSHREVRKTYLAIVCGRFVLRISIECIQASRVVFQIHSGSPGTLLLCLSVSCIHVHWPRMLPNIWPRMSGVGVRTRVVAHADCWGGGVCGFPWTGSRA